MTAQILNSELSNLVQESKRKNADLRAEADKSLDELKSLRGGSEAQLAADLSRRPNFITPLLIACNSKNAKFTGIAIVCLQRLVVSSALPSSRLREVLEAFREATSAGLDVQLKILQSLPSLLHNYPDEIKGELLASLLNTSFTLLASKNGMVNHTAAATLQQLFVAVFDKVVSEDKKILEIPPIAEAPSENGSVQVRAAAFDAYRVFNDVCLLAESEKAQFLKIASLPQTFALELIESILTNHADIFLTHPEEANTLRTRVMPFVISAVSGKLNFPTTVRVIRILYILLRRHLSILASEGEMAFGLITHMLDPDNPMWKRALCMEVLRGLFAEASLVRQIFALYDARNGRKLVLGTLIASFVKLSTEKPSVIGLGQQSTVPGVNPYTGNVPSNEQAYLDSSGVAGIISSPVVSGEANAGISTQWSTMRVPCIDQLDKSEPPPIPESYIYSLTLTCINTFSEGLAKFILPLTVPGDSRNRKKTRGSTIQKESESMQEADTSSDATPARSIMGFERSTSFRKNPLPINPFEMEDHPLQEDIKTCASIIDSCWPAILATCSTFLYAALDAEYYHGLVRSFQKFTHVAGLLRLSTPRDAFLTTLGKAAVPSNIYTASSAATSVPGTPATEQQSLLSNARGLLTVEALTSPILERPRRPSLDQTAPPSLNTRNLLCLRALLNLGIALGPTLDSAWIIILETLQQADFVLFTSSKGAVRSSTVAANKQDAQNSNDGSALTVNFGAELKAVETAASRLFESTVDFPNEPFLHIITALCTLFGREEEPMVNPTPSRPGSSSSMRRVSGGHRRMFSISTATQGRNQEDFFALAKLGDVATVNIGRLVAFDPRETGWELLTSELISAAASTSVASSVRLRAAEVLIKVALEAASATMSESSEVRISVQDCVLDTLRRALQPLLAQDRQIRANTAMADVDVHKTILEGFKGILEHCGESLISGWETGFDIITSVFISRDTPTDEGAATDRPRSSRSPRLVRTAFDSLQLICSDFLTSLPDSCFMILVDTLYNFCTQDDDLNICLTTVTFFWALSDFLSSKQQSFLLAQDLLQCKDEETLVNRISSEDRGTSAAALWMLLLLRLAAVTTDDRLELRNSAIQTLLRIFDAYGDQLSPEAWSVCTQLIIFKMLGAIEQRLRAAAESDPSDATGFQTAWIDTMVLVLNGVSKLLSSYIHVLTKETHFKDCWKRLLDHCQSLLTLSILDINTAVFKALSQILDAARKQPEAPAILDQESLHMVWTLWSRGLPQANEGLFGVNNQECLLAYIASFKQLYPMINHNTDLGQTRRILILLHEAVKEAKLASYSTDIEHSTPLQSEVMEVLQMLRTDIPGAPAILVQHVADFVSLAFENIRHTERQKDHPTYVALSKSAMTILRSLIVAHAENAGIYTGSGLASALSALAKPITIKYGFPIQTKSTPPWKHATGTAIAILQATVPALREDPSTSLSGGIATEDGRAIWDAIIQASNAIIAADVANGLLFSKVKDGEEFDIQSYQTLRALIIPALGHSNIPDKTRRAYTDAIFRTSIIHTPEPRELPQPGEDFLASLYKVRKGRTVDPKPSLRSKMSYVCLEELFSLVTARSGSPEGILLAKSAAPFLIMRVSLTLRAYTADQPLRGLMPQPLSQRKELLFILKALVELECEHDAIPDMPGVEGGAKNHLYRLYPLLAKAIRAAAKDQEVLEWLGKALDAVGKEICGSTPEY